MIGIRRMLLAGAAAGCCLTAADAAVIGDMQMTGARGGGQFQSLQLNLMREKLNQASVELAGVQGVYRADALVVKRAIDLGTKSILDDRFAAALLRLAAGKEHIFLPAPATASKTSLSEVRISADQEGTVATLKDLAKKLRRTITSPYEPFVVASRTMVVGVGYSHYPFDHADRTELEDDQDYRADYLITYVGYGVTDWLQAGLTLPFTLSADAGQAEQGTGGTGFGDISLDADLHLLRHASGYPFDLGIDARLQLASGDAAEGTGVGTTIGRVDLRMSRPFLGAENLRWYASLGRSGNLEDGADKGATNYALGYIWAGDAKGKSRDWSVWSALTGTCLDEEREEPGVEPYDRVQKVRFGAGRMFDRSVADSKRHHLVAFEAQIPTTRDGIWSSWSFQASYGLNWLPFAAGGAGN